MLGPQPGTNLRESPAVRSLSPAGAITNHRGLMAAGFLAFGIALFASLMLTVPVRALALRVGMVDLPGPRKVHLQPIPLLGGLAMWGAIMLAILFAFDGPARSKPRHRHRCDSRRSRRLPRRQGLAASPDQIVPCNAASRRNSSR